ncbi:MAG: MinD/ParA family protein [Candidatus Hodarchaeota archaeon]
MTSVITISSIRGGVGKSSLALELALHLTTKGKVLLIDTDFYAPTLFHEINSRQNEQLEKPKAYFRDVLRDICSVEESCVRVSSTLEVIFSDPRVNLWELSKDVGTKNFWIDDDPTKASPTEIGLAKLKEFVEKHSFEFLIFDTMAGLAYPVVFFCYISNHPIFLARPSLPQIKDVIGFINLIGNKDRPMNFIWSNVPNTNDYMREIRKKLENVVGEKCGDRAKSLGFIPRDPKFEEHALLGTLTMIPGKLNSSYNKNLVNIGQKLIKR